MWKNTKELALSEVEPIERAVGQVHGRRRLCVGWQNERLVVGAFGRTPLQHSSKSQFVSTVGAHRQHLERGEASPFRIGHGIVNPPAASFTVLVFLFNPDERTPAQVF